MALFLINLLILLVVDLESKDIINNDGETNIFVLFLPRDGDNGEDKEINDGSHRLFFYHRIRPHYFS